MAKKEVLIRGKRFLLGEKAAKIAIENLGGTEVLPVEKPRELFKKTLPPEIKPVQADIKSAGVIKPTPVIEPVEVKIPVKKPRKVPMKSNSTKK